MWKGNSGAWEWNWKMPLENNLRALCPKRRRMMELGITPLIDIIFLLLIFFMLTSRFVIHEGIGLELPVTQAPHTLQAEEVREITVLRDGSILFMGKPVTLSGLESWLADRDPGILPGAFEIRSDREAAVQIVVSILEVLRRQGAAQVSLGTTSVVDRESP